MKFFKSDISRKSASFQVEEFTETLVALFDKNFKEFSEAEMRKYLPPLLSALVC